MKGNEMTDTRTAAPLPDELEIELKGMSRSAFIVKGAFAVGSVYGATAVAPFVSQALAAESSAGDIGILNFALTLEYLEADFYRRALALNLSPKTKALARLIASHEAAHVAVLTQTVKKLGGRPAAKPVFVFPDHDEAGFLKLAQTLEDTGVGAYNGAGPMLQSKKLLAAAGSIVQVEARHAAAIRLANKVTPAPSGFDAALAKATVLKAVKPLIKA
jgi:5S rRNA maturation endonuclease (ribonuclease M5)